MADIEVEDLKKIKILLLELLPGIEDFLCKTLAKENLSEQAEQQRQYFVERLDILQLPPSVPPRTSATRLETTVEIHGSPNLHRQSSPDRELRSPTSIEDEDFVAYQRELSRSLLSGGYSEEELRVKLYDDIDHQNNNSEIIENEVNLYEIPVPKGVQSPPKENDYEETTIITNSTEKEEQSASPVPPPLPPRRDRTSSDAQSRSSCGSILEDIKPGLPLRPQLTPKSEIYKGSNERLVEDDFCDDLDGTSYESYTEEEAAKFNVQLPKPVKKSSKHKKLSKSRSSKEWDLNVPLRCLDELTLSGELLFKGKLSWTRKTCALSEGRLVCYKPDKCDSKPALVIQLTGYKSAFSEKDSRKGFDIKLTHPSLELHVFSVEFKEWASLWCDYINAMAEGGPPPGQYYHLARSSTFAGVDSSQIYGSKADLKMSQSQGSLTSCDGSDQDFVRSNSFNKPKVSRMGSFAFRASQFFESIGKKSGRKLSSVSSLNNLRESSGTSSPLGSPCTPVTTPDTPVFLPDCLPEIPALPSVRPITHSGYLCIYSNFNKRKWGKRWCLVRDNTFECYKNETSGVCELDFLLRYCKLRRAMVETKSELGLMLVEKAGEKITIEPLSREEMFGWLRVLMRETSTEEVPQGLEEFWIEEESPYHDINPTDLSSPTSDAGGYSSIKDHFNIMKHKCSEEENEDSALDITANTTLISDNQIPVDQSESDKSKIQGEVTGDLYSQVRRKSSESANGESLTSDHRISDNVFLFDEQDTNHLRQGDNSEDGGMFAEILNKINNHFSRENSLVSEEFNVQSDTAYNSAVCSENSSLERKPHQDVHSVSDNLDTLSQGTDIQVSPLEEFSPIIHTADHHNDGYENHINAKCINDQSTVSTQSFNQSSRTNFEITNTIIDQSNISVQTFSQTETTTIFERTNETIQTHLTVDSKSVSRDQCDSAIFESESILEDLDGNPKALLRKIEQLRTHLVELKKTRISVRNQKEQAVKDLDRNYLEEEYDRLDEECRTITDEISLLEERLSLHEGYDNC
ncbi:uncharacterized protein LOC127719885 isoform X1 [Mytilus californianus]|uniref:uncharacterized protein LOC127719885 isoform X1 n=1 Tax=Mytilus californianus TaxID=6549 RepID=UPI002248227F|nr:uncharacterized protein LOC127719885 isoform X1 [Mytilus californianus]